MRRFGLLLLVVAAVGVGIFIGRDPSDPPSPESPSISTPPALADLTITAATVERVADPDTCGGFTLCLIVVVANRGSANATGLEDGCGTPSFGDPQPWTDFTLGGSVSAGATVTFLSGYPGLEPHLPATFTLICEVDAAGRIDEADEGNNRFTTSVTL